ncbi:AraC family transcriptional regulator [Streptomyces sp. W16]|uniref:AraC family transcriptional regulator n=1 Tax=Streptomyces sp. W16 TaxID=3076631 RepID=UPI002E12E8A7
MNNLRIDLAWLLMLAEHNTPGDPQVTDWGAPVAAVARRVGYDDPAYFSRLFTRRVGMPPVRFRAQQGRAVPGGWSDQVPDPADPPMIGWAHST